MYAAPRLHFNLPLAAGWEDRPGWAKFRVAVLLRCHGHAFVPVLGDQVLQILRWLEIILLCRLNHSVDRGGRIGAVDRLAPQEILSNKNDVTKGALGLVVRQRDSCILEEMRKPTPMPERV